MTVVPVKEVEGGIKFAPLGLRGLFNPGAAVVSSVLKPPNSAVHFQLVVRSVDSPPSLSPLTVFSCRQRQSDA